MSRFLVIGASGFIGRNLMRFLAAECQAEVLGTRLHASTDGLLRFDITADSIVDCLPPAWRREASGSRVVLCAAAVPMDRCATEPDYATAVMLTGSQRCVDELSRIGYQPVFLSTSYVFDGETGGYAEADPTNPLSRYGTLKRAMEEYLERSHPESLILRLDKTIGADPAETHLLSEWHRSVRQGQPLVCIEGQQFGPTFVDDITRGLYLACRQGLTGCYHLANPVPSRRDELATQFLEVMRKKGEVRTVPLSQLELPEPRPLRSWLRSDKIRDSLGIDFTPVEQVLQEYKIRVASGCS